MACSRNLYPLALPHELFPLLEISTLRSNQILHMIRPSLHAACTYQYLQHDSKPHINTRQTKSTFLVNTTYVGWMQLLKAIRCWSFQMKFNWRIFSCCIPKMWHGLRHIPLPHPHCPLFTIYLIKTKVTLKILTLSLLFRWVEKAFFEHTRVASSTILCPWYNWYHHELLSKSNLSLNGHSWMCPSADNMEPLKLSLS